VAFTDNVYEGVYSVRLKTGGSMWRTISTAGSTGIHLKYAGRANNMDAGEALVVEWYDGSTWTTIDEITSSTYVYRDWTLPAAEDNPAFAVRFTGVCDKNTEWGNVDNIEVVGQ
jgi:hypothetical protein